MSYKYEENNEEDKDESSIEETDEEIIAEVAEDSPESGDNDARDIHSLTKEEEQLPCDKDKGLPVMIDMRKTHMNNKRR